MIKRNFLIYIIIAAIATPLILISSTYPPFLAATGYTDCVETIGACGTVNPGTNGYPCLNEHSVCEQGSGGNADHRCTTKTHWLWGCSCDCGC